MRFALTVWQAADGRRLWLLVAMFISTLSPVGVLAVINAIIKNPATYREDHSLLLWFALAAAGVIGGYAVGSRLSVDTVETLLHRLRMRLADRIRRIELSELEQIGGTRVYDTLTRNTAVISEAAMAVLPGYAALGSLVLGGIYTLLLSPVVFLALAVILAASAFFFLLSQQHTRTALQQAAKAETGFLQLFGHLLSGFKEVRLHWPRGQELEQDFVAPASRELHWARVEAAVRINRGGSLSYGFFYVMLATIAFVLPPYVGDPDIVVESLYVAVFLLSMVEIIIKTIPLVARADFAMEELEAMEESLLRCESGRESAPAPAAFERILLGAVTYSYRDPSGTPLFTVGPISLEIVRGETLFLVGGNGSGKSTLLRILSRLYPPDGGTILWDGEPVGSARASAYRALFSAVFTDFHLFDRLYGLPERSATDVNRLLRELGIGHKVRFEDGAFSTTALSTGQRKRLAFAVAVLEERPILVLDELAADQDRDFRERFYTEILPRLKGEGRTLIVVSHDDPRRFGADRVVTLRDGQVVQDSRVEGDPE